MPTPKSDFAVAHWKETGTLFTVGGWNVDSLKEVRKYSLSKNAWKLHSLLLKDICSSSAVVLNNVMYNIGGYHSSHSVMWCQLSSTYPAKWKLLDFPNYSFKEFHDREAFVL